MKYLIYLLASLASLFLISATLMEQNKASMDDIEVPESYTEYCAQCHGANLQGGNAQSLVDGVWQFGDGRSYIFRNIKFGIQHLGMPSYEESLSDDQIYSLVDFFREVEETMNISAPPLPTALETQDYKIKVETVAESLEIPWAIDFIDGNNMLITERPGRLRMVENGKLLAEPVAGTPEVLHEGQGGLMDVALDPQYQDYGWVYLAYSHEINSSGGENRPPAMTRLVRGKIENNTWTDQEVIFEAPHDTYRTTRHHYGCRIVFDPDGYLYFSIGDRGASDQAQDVTRPNGKIHRIYTNGDIPEDNPFFHKKDAIKSIFTFGNRNPQGLAVHPKTGLVWETEHGPFGGDELNLITGGVNYGWPVITYGRNYNGTPITDQRSLPGMSQPNLYWNLQLQFAD